MYCTYLYWIISPFDNDYCIRRVSNFLAFICVKVSRYKITIKCCKTAILYFQNECKVLANKFKMLQRIFNSVALLLYKGFAHFSPTEPLKDEIYMLLSGSLANSNIRNKHILISHKQKLILLPDTFS